MKKQTTAKADTTVKATEVVATAKKVPMTAEERKAKQQARTKAYLAEQKAKRASMTQEERRAAKRAAAAQRANRAPSGWSLMGELKKSKKVREVTLVEGVSADGRVTAKIECHEGDYRLTVSGAGVNANVPGLSISAAKALAKRMTGRVIDWDVVGTNKSDEATSSGPRTFFREFGNAEVRVVFDTDVHSEDRAEVQVIEPNEDEVLVYLVAIRSSLRATLIAVDNQLTSGILLALDTVSRQ